MKDDEKQVDQAEDQRRLDERMAAIGRKLLVLSGKGGVGKSTVAANLATALAARGCRVGLLDVDLHGPSIPRLMGLEGQQIGADGVGGIEPMQISENLAVVSVGLMLKSLDDAVVWRGPLKYNVIRQLLRDVEWGPLDYLVIDAPPGTGDEPLSVAQMVGPGAAAVLVTTPQQVALNDVRRSISFCRMLGLPVAGLIENMGSLICPDCGKRVSIFPGGGAKDLATQCDLPYLGEIPMDPAVAAGGDRGEPFTEYLSESPAAAAFAACVEGILKQTQSSDTADEAKENKTMKIAIPTAEGRLCMHFGHCEQFALLETADDGSVVKTEYLTPPPHEPGLLPRWLAEKGVKLVIAGGMGRRAQDIFTASGIQVLVGAQADAPEAIVAAWAAGSLTTGDNVCDH